LKWLIGSLMNESKAKQKEEEEEIKPE